MRETLNKVGFNDDIRGLLWKECEQFVTIMNKICVQNKNDKSPYEWFYGKKNNFVRNLKPFGDIVIVKSYYDGMQSKLKNRRKKMLFIGYRNNHGRGVFRMYDLVKRKVFISRDVLWLNLIHVWWKTKNLRHLNVKNPICRVFLMCDRR